MYWCIKVLHLSTHSSVTQNHHRTRKRAHTPCRKKARTGGIVGLTVLYFISIIYLFIGWNIVTIQYNYYSSIIYLLFKSNIIIISSLIIKLLCLTITDYNTM